MTYIEGKRGGLGMRIFIFLLTGLLMSIQGHSLSHYWLIQQDFIKIGKKELYEEERKKKWEEDRIFFKKKKTPLEVIAAQDLENPQYVFFMPLKDLSSLDLYSPIQKNDSPLLNTCLNFQIFSLHELLPDCSFQSALFFSESRPYLSYVLYDITPGSQKSFEDHLMQIALKQQKKSGVAWNAWKVLIGADGPAYLLCASFASKKELKESQMEEIFEEALVKDILRNRKSGWMKREDSFSLLKKS